MCASIIGQEHVIALITAYFLLQRSDSGNKRTEHDVGVGVRIQVNRTGQLDFFVFLETSVSKNLNRLVTPKSWGQDNLVLVSSF
jgi:hypothetical protein